MHPGVALEILEKLPLPQDTVLWISNTSVFVPSVTLLAHVCG